MGVKSILGRLQETTSLNNAVSAPVVGQEGNNLDLIAVAQYSI